MLKSANLLHKRGFGDSQSSSTVGFVKTEIVGTVTLYLKVFIIEELAATAWFTDGGASISTLAPKGSGEVDGLSR